MDRVEYVFMEDMAHAGTVLSMMNRLYVEDDAASDVDKSLFPQTLHKLLTDPAMGRVVLMRVDGQVQGYALLISYWSNEYGGVLVYVDELYVMPEWRGRGIGSGLFRWLISERPFDAVGIFLEVSPRNRRAQRLYERIGFTERRNRILEMRIATPQTNL